MKANEKARERDAMDDGGKEKDKSRTQDRRLPHFGHSG
jgi:hypothetical protein